MSCTWFAYLTNVEGEDWPAAYSAMVGQLFNGADPTGAGDSFAGGFMGYLAQAKAINKAAIKKAIGYGTVIASFNVEGFGLERTARLTLREIHQRFHSYRKNLIL